MKTKYKTKIIEALKSGAKIQSSEGANYKTWLVYQDGKTENIRRDTANKICQEFESKLVFGKKEGIFWRNYELNPLIEAIHERKHKNKL